MTLGRDIITQLGLNLKVFEHIIEAYDGPFIGSTVTVVNLGAYTFEDLNTGKVKPEDSFRDAYVEEVYESEHVSTVT